MDDRDASLAGRQCLSRVRFSRWFATKRLAASLLTLFLVSRAFGQLDAANQLYDQERFTEAKQKYEELLANGERNANLFYNLGNTFLDRKSVV